MDAEAAERVREKSRRAALARRTVETRPAAKRFGDDALGLRVAGARRPRAFAEKRVVHEAVHRGVVVGVAVGEEARGLLKLGVVFVVALAAGEDDAVLQHGALEDEAVGLEQRLQR